MTKLLKATLTETAVLGEFNIYLENDDWVRLAKIHGNRITGILRLKYEEPVVKN